MFYDVFDMLCRKNHTTPSAVCSFLGYSNSTASYWKTSGRTPKREALEKIAEYFGVTVDSLLGRNDAKEKPLEPIALRASVSEWTELLNSLSDENLIKLRDYAQLLILQQHSQA